MCSQNLFSKNPKDIRLITTQVKNGKDHEIAYEQEGKKEANDATVN